MLQTYIEGPDVRVHFVGYEHSAIMFKTEGDDYRYASRNGFELTSEVTTIRPDLVEKCYGHMRSERLEFAGFDFKVQLKWRLVAA